MASAVRVMEWCRDDAARKSRARTRFEEILHLVRVLPAEAALRIGRLLELDVREVHVTHVWLKPHLDGWGYDGGLICLDTVGRAVALIKRAGDVVVFLEDGTVRVLEDNLSNYRPAEQQHDSRKLLSDDTLAHVFTFLDFYWERNVRLVCKQWARVGRMDIVWNRYLLPNEWRSIPRGEAMSLMPILAPNLVFGRFNPPKICVGTETGRSRFFWMLVSLLAADERSFEDPRQYTTEIVFKKGWKSGLPQPTVISHRRFHMFRGDKAVTVGAVCNGMSKNKVFWRTNVFFFRNRANPISACAHSWTQLRHYMHGDTMPLRFGVSMLDSVPERKRKRENL